MSDAEVLVKVRNTAKFTDIVKQQRHVFLKYNNDYVNPRLNTGAASWCDTMTQDMCREKPI